MSIRLISTDFDGTLFDEFASEPVPVRLQERLRALQAAGAVWVINTGRDLASLMEVMGRAGMQVLPNFVVAVEREVYRHTGHRYIGLEPWNGRCAADHQGLFERHRHEISSLMASLDERHDATIYSDAWSPLCVIASSFQEMDLIEQEISVACAGWPEVQTVRNDVYLRLAHRGYDKGSALQEICRLESIGRDEVFAVGDHFNDLPMLRPEIARYLGTVANAQPRVVTAVRGAGGRVSPLRAGLGVLELLELFGREGNAGT